MTQKLARFISILFHPLIMLMWVIIVFLFIHPYYSTSLMFNARLYILLSMFLMLFLFPIAGMWVLKNGQIIDSFELKTRQERQYPYLLTAAIIGITAYQIRHILPGLLPVFLISTVVLLLVLLLINFKLKISAHAAGVSSALALMIYIVFGQKNIQLWWLISFFTVIMGLVIWARLELKAHNAREVFWGILVGFFVVSIGLNIYIY